MGWAICRSNNDEKTGYWLGWHRIHTSDESRLLTEIQTDFLAVLHDETYNKEIQYESKLIQKSLQKKPGDYAISTCYIWNGNISIPILRLGA